MGAISRLLGREPVDAKPKDRPGTKTVDAELPPDNGWIKVNGKYTFWYKTKPATGSRVSIEAKVFIENGIEKSVDLETGAIVSKKYADYDHYSYVFDDEETASGKLLDRVANDVEYRYGGRSNRKRVYL